MYIEKVIKSIIMELHYMLISCWGNMVTSEKVSARPTLQEACGLFIWKMGYRNASFHNMFMISVFYLPSPWSTSLHFYFHEMYPSYYQQMFVLSRYIFEHKMPINIIITLLFHFFQKVTHHNHVTNLVCLILLSIWSHQFILYLCSSF
jgi:hypothetical protein